MGIHPIISAKELKLVGMIHEWGCIFALWSAADNGEDGGDGVRATRADEDIEQSTRGLFVII
jgi:hypothetical protein